MGHKYPDTRCTGTRFVPGRGVPGRGDYTTGVDSDIAQMCHRDALPQLRFAH